MEAEIFQTSPTKFEFRQQRQTRIFQIGFNKCGTRSIYRFLQRSDIHSAHFNRGKLASFIARNVDYGRKPLFGINRYTAYTDIQHINRKRAIEGAHYYRELFNYYPYSYFILNTRDRDGWINSRLNHGAGFYAERYRLAMNLDSIDDVVKYWAADWDRHHEQVQEFFSDKPGRLIVYDIKNDTPQKMVDFLKPDFTSKAEHFLHEGDTGSVNPEEYLHNKPVLR